MGMRQSLIDKITIYIELDLEKENKRDAIMKSLIADNVNFPDGLEMHMHSVSESILSIEFKSVGSIETLTSTIDEILGCISIGNTVLSND
jgi:hypothetical protein